MSRGLPASSALEPSLAQDRKALRLILPFLWPRDDRALRLRLLGTMVLLGLSALLNAVVPILFASAVDRLSAPEQALLTVPLALLLAYGAMHWLARGLNELRWVLYAPIEQRIRRRLGLAVFRHVHDLSLGFHLRRRTGELSRVLDNGMDATSELLFDGMFLVLPLLAEVLIICAVLLGRYEVTFAAVIAGTLVVYTLTLILGAEWLRQHQRRAVAVGASAQGRAVDSLLNYETVKLFGNEAHVASRYDRSLREVEELTVRARAWRSLLGLLQVTILGAAMVTLLLLAAGKVAGGTMTVGDFVLVNTYLLQMVRPLDRLSVAYRSIKQHLTQLEQMLMLLDERAEVRDAPGATPLPDGPGRIRFEDVVFAYRPDLPGLRDVSFTVPSGATTALVGPSGAGKTTIARLLFRFYDVDDGRILIDGRDIRSITQESLRGAIAVVPQDTVLFNESILYNIAFGAPDASCEAIREAARLASIDRFIESLPEGYDTVVGERGLKLSGGEKQRVAIARAVLKRPRIFLFDEATSALDSHTERAIQENLKDVSRGTTTLIIAHRLSTVVHADQILFLDDGRIVERGTHRELLIRGGRYAALWAQQLQSRERSPEEGRSVA